MTCLCKVSPCSLLDQYSFEFSTLGPTTHSIQRVKPVQGNSLLALIWLNTLSEFAMGICNYHQAANSNAQQRTGQRCGVGRTFTPFPIMPSSTPELTQEVNTFHQQNANILLPLAMSKKKAVAILRLSGPWP